MARNGSGTYSLPQAPFTPGTTISSAAVNSDLSDIGAALTQSISKDGQTVYTGNQPMGGNKLTGLGIGSSPADSVRVSQVADGAINYGGTAGGTADDITLAPTPGISAYAAGQTFTFKAASTNTGAMTVNVSTVGAGALVWPNGTAMAAGDIVAGGVYEIAVSAATPVFHLQNTSAPPLARVGGTLTGTLTMSGAAINEAVRVDVASATTTDIGAAASNYVRITGTTPITGLGTIASGVRRQVVFADALTLTHNATSLILPTGANIATAAGDCALFESEGSGNWRCVNYQRADGTPLAPIPQQYAQAYCTVSGGVLTTQKSTGFTSIVRDSQGLFTCTLSTAMPDTNYVVEFTCGAPSGAINRYCGEDLSSARTTTVFHLYVNGDNIAAQDPANLNIRVYA